MPDPHAHVERVMTQRRPHRRTLALAGVIAIAFCAGVFAAAGAFDAPGPPRPRAWELASGLCRSGRTAAGPARPRSAARLRRGLLDEPLPAGRLRLRADPGTLRARGDADRAHPQ